MSLLTTVFLCIFGVIYFVSWNNCKTQVNFELNTLMHEPPGMHKQFNSSPGKGSNILGVVINLNSSREVIDIMCPYDSDRDVFIEYADKLVASNETSGKIDINGTSFAFLKSMDTGLNRIVLVNRTSQVNTLTNLLKTFIITGTLSLGLLFFVSYYFANKSIQPIMEVFTKQKQFIADASHELRTPLAIIKTNLSLLTSNQDETVLSQKKWINYIDDQTNRMSELINDMLSLAKLDIDTQQLQLMPTNINDILENLIMSFEAVFFENHINIEEQQIEQLSIEGNPPELKKLFSILIDNAIKHTPENGSISISVRKNKNKAEVIVRNTGEGIAPEHLQKIFERFYRPDDSRQRNSGGYGLGLAIAAAIVKQHHGNIHAESILGQYTSFIVTFPLPSEVRI